VRQTSTLRAAPGCFPSQAQAACMTHNDALAAHIAIASGHSPQRAETRQRRANEHGHKGCETTSATGSSPAGGARAKRTRQAADRPEDTNLRTSRKSEANCGSQLAHQGGAESAKPPEQHRPGPREAVSCKLNLMGPRARVLAPGERTARDLEACAPPRPQAAARICGVVVEWVWGHQRTASQTREDKGREAYWRESDGPTGESERAVARGAEIHCPRSRTRTATDSNAEGPSAR